MEVIVVLSPSSLSSFGTLCSHSCEEKALNIQINGFVSPIFTVWAILERDWLCKIVYLELALSYVSWDILQTV